MKLIIISIFFLLSIFVYSQGSYFNRRYDFYGKPDNAADILEYNNGFIICGTTINNVSGKVQIALLFIDTYGNIIWKKSIGLPDYHYFPARLVKLQNGNFALGGETNDIYGDFDPLLIMFDGLFDILLMKTYGTDSVHEAILDFISTPDDGFAMTGQYSFGGDSDFLLMKLDAAGNMLWMKKYGNSFYQLAFSLDNTLDSGFIMGGYGWKNANGNTETYIIKADRSGNQIWAKYYGDIYNDWGTSDIMTTTDGGFIFTNAVAHVLSPNPNPVFMKPYVYRLSANGTILWVKSFGSFLFDNSHFFRNITELDDGNFLLTGNFLDDIYGSRGWLLEINSTGDSIWSGYLDNHPEADDYLSDLILLEDGIITCGTTYYSGSIDSFLNANQQNMWIVRLNELRGCDSTSIADIHISSILISGQEAIQLTWADESQLLNRYCIERMSFGPFKDWEIISNPVLIDGKIFIDSFPGTSSDHCYRITGINLSGNVTCPSQITCLSTNLITSPNFRSDFIISPVPAMDRISIFFDSFYDIRIIYLKDISGCNILHWNLVNDPNSIFTMDISDFADGLYFISVLSESGAITTKKIMISK